jgi:hypothetical protein
VTFADKAAAAAPRAPTPAQPLSLLAALSALLARATADSSVDLFAALQDMVTQFAPAAGPQPAAPRPSALRTSPGEAAARPAAARTKPAETQPTRRTAATNQKDSKAPAPPRLELDRTMWQQGEILSLARLVWCLEAEEDITAPPPPAPKPPKAPPAGDAKDAKDSKAPFPPKVVLVT